jgi:hypothetical protein
VLRTLDGLNDRGKLDQEAIARRFDDMAVVGSDGSLDDLVMHGQYPQRASFIGAHLAAKPHEVSKHDGRQFAGLGMPHTGVVLDHGDDYRPRGMRLSNGRGLVAVPSLRSDAVSEVERDMRVSQVISTCPGCAAQAVRTGALCQEIARLQAEVNRLKAQLSRTSANSHQPPSSDPPPRARTKVRELSTRPWGGQPGHRGTTRPLLPVAEVDELHVCQPSHCAGCGSPLTGSDPAPLRHQVTEFPPLQPRVAEYQLQALRCERCGVRTRAPLSEGVPERTFGARLQALVAVLSGAYRLSKRNIQQLLADCFGVELALGSLSALEYATSEALQEPVVEARRFVQQQPVAHVDETGWREANHRAWLWTAVTEAVTVFLIRGSRGSQGAKELLGTAFAGILVSDRWSGYRWVPLKHRQLCWAHPVRTQSTNSGFCPCG